jgi:dTDP-4-amino-4,6-dideoxygalactose transaminase
MASASCAVLRGLVPVFVDVDRDSQTLDPAAVAAAISPRTRAIIAVHLAGWPCDMAALRRLADDHGLRIVEDCAQAHGATFNGVPVGSLGDIGVFLLLSGQDHHHGGRGRDAGHERRRMSGSAPGLTRITARASI